MREIRGNAISMIFQEPMTSLNPVLTVGQQIGETVRLHQGMDAREAEQKAIEMLTLVGIPAPVRRVREYPHQLSGGMRQRVMIAMALACNPKLLIADEPTTALDVTIQAQILDLMRDLKQRLGSAIMLITHDLGVVAEMAERVVVMYAGRKVEEATVGEIFARPLHPYTRGLLGAVPKLGSSLHEGGRGRAGGNPRPGAVASQADHRLRVRRALPDGDRGLPPGRARDRNEGQRASGGLPPRRTADGGMSANRPLLEVNGLKKHFPIHGGMLGQETARVYAVDGVTFSIDRGETLSLVGEIRLRQIHRRQGHPAAAHADRGRGLPGRRAHRQPAGRRSCDRYASACRWCFRTRSPASIHA